MTARPLTKEERIRAKRRIRRLSKSSQQLYDFLAEASISYNEFKYLFSSLQSNLLQVIRQLEELRKIREFIEQMPLQPELDQLGEALEKLRV